MEVEPGANGRGRSWGIRHGVVIENGLIGKVIRRRHGGVERTQRLDGVVVRRDRGYRGAFVELQVIVVVIFELFLFLFAS